MTKLMMQQNFQLQLYSNQKNTHLQSNDTGHKHNASYM
jgi:hypothetical protein